jgi:endonuclease/exonuclease/phosphatase family metal-dependent hydrolase
MQRVLDSLKASLKAAFPNRKKVITRVPTVLLLVWLALWLLGNSFSAVGVLATALGPVVCLLAAVWVLVSLSLKDWIAATTTALVVAVAAVGFQVVPSQEPLPNLPASQKPHSLTSVNVVEVNALLGTASPYALTRLVRSSHADFLIVAESNDTFLNPGLIRAGMEKVLPYRYSIDTGNLQPGAEMLGNAIWSRWPIDAKRRVPGTFNPTLAIDVTINNFPITVVATRAQNPLISRSQWASDLRAVAKFVPTVPKNRRLIVAGDFNSGFGHAPFESVLAAGLQDAQAKVNWPWKRVTFPTFTSPTKPADIPILQIDHVLFGSGWHVNRAQSVMIPRTDHTATSVELWVTRR